MKGGANGAAEGYRPDSAFEGEARWPHQPIISTELTEGVARIALDGVHDLTLLVLGDGGIGELLLVTGIKSVRLTQGLACFPACRTRQFHQFRVIRGIAQQGVSFQIAGVGDERVDSVVGEELSNQPTFKIGLGRQTANRWYIANKGILVGG